MRTQIVNEQLLRWKGTLADLTTIATEAQRLIKEKTGDDSTCQVRTTIKRVETVYDSHQDFTSSVVDDIGRIERIVITVGDFDRDSSLSTEVTFQGQMGQPGILLKVRGHDEAYVEWLGKTLLEKVAKGSRRLPLKPGAIVWIILGLFVIGQYFFYSYVEIPDLGDLGDYVFIILATILPMVFVYAGLYALHWLVPTLELLPVDGATRWERYRRRTKLAAGAIVGSILIPLLVAILKKRLDL